MDLKDATEEEISAELLRRKKTKEDLLLSERFAEIKRAYESGRISWIYKDNNLDGADDPFTQYTINLKG